MNNQAQPVLLCENLTKTYHEGPQDICVLDNLYFSVEKGERVAIVGKSGAGKTTLLNMLGSLDLPTKGMVKIEGQDVMQMNANERGALRNRSLGFVYQLHHLLPDFTAVENVAIPLLIRGVSPKEAEIKAELLLNKVGLAERLTHKPAQLSGGERQRVAIARSLVTEPACVLLDEPTGNLDIHTAEAVHDLMLALSTDLGISFVVVTHDLALAKRMDRQLELVDGQLHLIHE